MAASSSVNIGESAKNFFETVAKNTDIIMALLVLGIVLVMILPIPAILLDLLLSFNITFSIIILLVSMYTLNALDFSIFPSLLLITTLFRLSLNVSSTRLILLNGNRGREAAGAIISSFGDFVVGGNYVVGLVVFSILVLINFVVITKGAGRIAEVAARFTLDAMPGKQMSIDADLNAGLINDTDARNRRLTIEREADFYGAMDGASKFVRGDAVAGILITFINILGGLVIGILQHNMDIAEAARTYIILTVGDGLVSQIPALIISTAAGTIVTRSTSDSNMGDDITRQLSHHPRAIAIATGIMLCLALVPGLPQIPFLILAGACGGISYRIINKQKLEKEKLEAKAREDEKKEKAPDNVEALLRIDTLEMEVGYGLISMVNEEQGGTLLERIKTLRKQAALDLGLVVPPVRIRDNLELKPNEYSISIKRVSVGEGEIILNKHMAMNAGDVTGDIPGIPTTEPAFGLPATWINESEKEMAMERGYTVVDAVTVVATHISEIINKHAHELLGRQDTQNLMDNLKEVQPKLVEELVPNILTLGIIQKVLQNLLREKISIRDLSTICETLSNVGSTVKDPNLLTELVRESLARHISSQLMGGEKKIKVFTLHPALEQEVVNSVEKTEQGISYLSMEPEKVQTLLTRLEGKTLEISSRNIQPIFLCSPHIRMNIKQLTERFIPNLIVISHSEVAKDVEIENLGVVNLGNES